MRGGGTAAATDQVHEAAGGEVADVLLHLLGVLVVLAHFVGEAGVGVGVDVAFRDLAQSGQVGTHLLSTQGTVEADAERVGVGDAVVERFDGLAGERSARSVGDGAGDHHRQLPVKLFADAVEGEEGGFCVEGVEDGLDQDEVRAAVGQAFDLGVVRIGQFGEGDGAVAGVVHVRADAEGAVGGAYGAGDEAGLGRVAGRVFVGGLARNARGGNVHFVNDVLRAVVFLRDGGAGERIGLDNVGPGFQIKFVDLADHVRAGEHQQVVVALQVAGVVFEVARAVVFFLQPVALDEGAHRAVEYEDAFGENLVEGRGGHGLRFKKTQR